jgi:ribosomal protein S18 acetylase RimI-like enzyme
MWVAPEARREGVGRQLIDAVADWASSWGGSRIVLWVYAANVEAQRFYTSLNFEFVSDGPDAESGSSYGALAMVKPIDAVPPSGEPDGGGES